MPRVNKQKMQPTHTRPSYFFSLLGIFGFLWLSIRYGSTGSSWGNFSLYVQLPFITIGYFGYQILSKQPIFPKKFREFDVNTILSSVIVLVIVLGFQIIFDILITITGFEQAMFTLCAAIGEELFFRGFLISLILYLLGDTPTNKVIASIISATSFALAHVNYYNNLAVMLSVFASGLVYSFAFLQSKRNITIPMLGHLGNNLFVVIQMIGFGILVI